MNLPKGLKPEITIIIPTRNGSPYIKYAVESALAQKYTSLEIIVSVNHSQDSTLELLSKYKLDRRMRVISPPKVLSLSGHYEWCIKQANGDWITILGDDDALLPHFSVEVQRILRQWSEKGAEAISFRRAYFFWPGCEDIYRGKTVSFTGVHRSKMNRSPRLLLLSAITGATSHVDLPELYTNNLVRRDLIEKISRCSDSVFYKTRSADVYSGVAIALSAAVVIRSEMPVFITGTSPKSLGFSKTLSKKNNHGPANTRYTEHIQLSANEKLNKVQVFSDEFYNLCGSSSVYVVSALLSCPLWKKKRFLAKGVVALALAERCLQAAISYARRARMKQEFSMVIKECSLLSIPLPLVLVAMFFFPTLRMYLRAKSAFGKVTDLFSNRETIQVDLNGHALCKNITDAGQLMSRLYREIN